MIFWDSVTALRKIEFVTIMIATGLPFLFGSVLLTVRLRIKALQTQYSQNQGLSYHDTVQHLEEVNHRLNKELDVAQAELSGLRRVTAPRQITESQEAILVEKLSGVKAAPVIVAAYAFEDESADYAEQITAVLRKAGWDAVLSKASMNDFKGISLGTINLMQRPVSGLHELAAAFTEARFDLHQRQISPDSIAGKLQDGTLLVVVGRK